MDKENTIKIFEQKQVRAVWVVEREKWFVSIIDVIEVLYRNRPAKKILE